MLWTILESDDCEVRFEMQEVKQLMRHNTARFLEKIGVNLKTKGAMFSNDCLHGGIFLCIEKLVSRYDKWMNNDGLGLEKLPGRDLRGCVVCSSKDYSDVKRSNLICARCKKELHGVCAGKHTC